MSRVAQMEEKRSVCMVLVEGPKERGHFEDVDVRGHY